MIIYILPYIILLFGTYLSFNLKEGGYKYLFFLSFLPAIFIVTFRGFVGTDTFTYVQILSSTSSELVANVHNVDFLFKNYVQVSQALNLDPLIALNILGFVLSILILYIFSANKHAYFIFVFLVFPIFYYDMTMNGIRYGLAFILATPLIIKLFGQGGLFCNTYILYIIALLNHKSVALFLAFKLLLKFCLRNILLLIIFFGFLGLILNDYLSIKLLAYLKYPSPSILSGIQPLLLMIGLVIINTLFFRSNIKRNFLLLIIQIAFYVITQFSYAGIRLQFLILFFLIILLIVDGQSKHYSLYLLLLFIIGLLGFILKMRNMLDGYGVGNSPFLPYQFFWS